MEKVRICLVEDDPTIGELVQERLIREGYSTDLFDNAEAVAATEAPWDFYILDIMLGGDMSGLELCDRIRRQWPRIPILILSAMSEPSDRIEGLKTGADDYLTKPFEMEELLLRVAGMLGRRNWYQTLPANKSFNWGQNSINFESYEAKTGTQKFMLSQKECMIMKLLIEHEGQVVGRDEILNRVWGYDAFPSTRTVDNFILRLRKHFEKSPSEPKYIHSVRGVGYRFESGRKKS